MCIYIRHTMARPKTQTIHMSDGIWQAMIALSTGRAKTFFSIPEVDSMGSRGSEAPIQGSIKGSIGCKAPMKGV